MTQFKVGDKVVKARPYKEDYDRSSGRQGNYCRFGGSDKEVPINTKGVVTSVDKTRGSVEVRFADDWKWDCDTGEIDFAGEKMKKTKGKVIKYKPGTSIKDFVRKLLKREKDKDRLKWLRTFDNCVLPKEVKNTIDEAITVVLSADKFEKWGINEHFEKGITNSILIYGPPGTGKTMVSESIAAILDKNLMKVSTAEVLSNIPGGTERNIENFFKEATKKNCVMMFDECDSLLYDRDSVGAILSAQTNCLLTSIERFNGVVILTTNRLHKLDMALQRRIIAKVCLPLPDKDARYEIWQKLIPPKLPIAKNIDYHKLSEHSISGGEIKNSILLAVRKVVARNEKRVNMGHFEEGVKSVLQAKEDYEGVQYKRVGVSGEGELAVDESYDIKRGVKSGVKFEKDMKDIFKK